MRLDIDLTRRIDNRGYAVVLKRASIAARNSQSFDALEMLDRDEPRSDFAHISDPLDEYISTAV